MILSTLPETRRRWNCFSKVDLLGAFDFYTYTVSLDSIQPNSLSKALNCLTKHAAGQKQLTLDEYRDIDKPLSLAMHEYTHFVDASSTLWGLRHLQLLNAGNEAYANPQGEKTFPPAKQLFDHVRSIRWPDYYTEHYNLGIHTNRPWRAEVTGGRVFDSDGNLSKRPIVFIRFSDAQGKLIVRSPLSTVSVLEASAYGQELMFRMSLTSALQGNVHLIESREISRNVMDYIYDKDLTEYSVCAHLFANRQGCTDAAMAYSSVALLARWALNMPCAALPTLGERLGSVLKDVLGWDPASDSTTLIREGIDAHDIGTIFYVLVCCLPIGSHLSRDRLFSGLGAAIGRFGLDLRMVRDLAEVEATQAADTLSRSPIESVRALAAAGLLNLKSISLQQNELSMPTLHLPKVVLGDLSLAHPFPSQSNALLRYDVERGYDELVKGQIWIERFAEACF